MSLPVAEDDETTIRLLDGQPYILSPLTMRQTKRVKALIPVYMGGGEEAEDAAVEIIHMGLAKRQPALTIDALGDLIEFRMSPIFIRKLMELNGKMPGEAQAG